MDHSDFDSVSWRNDADSDPSRPNTSHTDTDEPERSSQDVNGKRRMSSTDNPSPPAHDDDEGLAALEGTLECTVDTPLKENEGTKDVFISYLVTTHVGSSSPLVPATHIPSYIVYRLSL